MTGRTLLLLTACLLASLSGCDSDPGTGPVDVKWDRDACERCRMVLSDRHFAAQIRVPPDVLGKRGKVLRFDDIGCAVLWLDEQPWKDRPGVEIWVKDHRDGAWLDARAAHYVAVKNTPMEYGLGAQKDAVPGVLGFADAVAHIYDVEKRFAADGTVTIPHPPTAVESR